MKKILKIQETKKNVLSEGIITARPNLRSTEFHCVPHKHSKYNFWIKLG